MKKGTLIFFILLLAPFVVDGGYPNSNLPYHSKDHQILKLIGPQDGMPMVEEVLPALMDHLDVEIINFDAPNYLFFHWEKLNQLYGDISKLLDNNTFLNQLLAIWNQHSGIVITAAVSLILLLMLVIALLLKTRQQKKLITKLNKAETSLRESKDFLSRSQRIAHVGSWKLDLTKNKLSWSDEVYRIFGCEPQQFTATYEAFLDFVHPDDRAAVDESYSSSLQEGRDSYEIEHRIIRKDTGEIRHVHERCVHERDDAGNIIQSIGMVQDITEKKRHEKELARESTRRRILMEQSRDGIVILKQDGKVFESNKKFADMLGYPPEYMTRLHATDWEYQHSPEKLKEMLQSFDEKGDFFQTKHKRKDGSIYDVEISINAAWFEDQKLIFCICRDITERKQVEEANRKRAERAKLQRNLIAELTFDETVVNSNVDEALKLITSKLAATLNVDRTSVWLLSEDQTKLRRLMLYDAASGHHPQINVLNTNDFPTYIEALRSDSQIGAENAQNDLRTKELAENYLNPLQISSSLDSAIQHDGHLLGVLSAEDRGPIREWHPDEKSFLSAITNLIAQVFANADRKRAEEALKESQTRLEAILNHSPLLISEFDPEGTYLLVNPILAKFYEMSTTEVIGKKLSDLLPHDTATKFMGRIERVKREQAPITIEDNILTDAGMRYYLTTLFPLEDETGNLRSIGSIAHDITERKLAEEALRESEKKYRALFNQSTEGIYLHDLDGCILDVNDVACEQSGYTREEWLKFTVFEGHPHQSTKNPPKEEILKTWREWEPGQRYTIEAEHQRKDGNIYPVEISIGKIRYGTTNAILAIVKDISERKQTEEKLKLLNRAVEASSVSVVITDAEGTINYVNPYFTEVTQYTFEEVVGENPRVLKSGYQSAAFYKDLWDTIKSGEEWTGEFQNLKKNGELFWERAVISPILNDSGEITHFVAIKEDITERKKIWEELVAAIDDKEKLIRELSHRSFNNMQVIKALLEYKLLTEPDISLEHFVIDTTGHIQAMALAHSELNKGDSLSRINLKEYLKTLVHDIVDHNRVTPDIKLSFDLEPKQVLLDSAVPLGVTINELLSNALKSAFSGDLKNKSNAEIMITSRTLTTGEIEIRIAYNGITQALSGDSDTSPEGENQLAIAMINEQLEGRVTFDKSNGTTIITFKDNRYTERV